MPKANRGGRRQASSQNTASTGGRLVYNSFDDDEAQALREEVEGNYTPSVLDAIKQYISKATDTQGYSKSQNLNYKLDNDMPLNANEKYMLKYMQQGMHDIGKNITLYRGAHDDLLKSLGVNNYQNMSEKQLQQALIGAQYQTKGFTSTSYDKSKNPFYVGANSGGREIEMVIHAPSNTKMVFGAKSQTEIVLNRGTKYQITGVRYTGRTATPRNAGSKKVLELEVQVIG